MTDVAVFPLYTDGVLNLLDLGNDGRGLLDLATEEGALDKVGGGDLDLVADELARGDGEDLCKG